MESEMANGQELVDTRDDPVNTWWNCSRNSGHANLIPIDDFSADDFEFGFKKGELVELIKLLGYLTVKISVPFSSPARPAKSHSRCHGDTRIGTGKIYVVRKISDEPCPCSSCIASGNPEFSWAEITVVTSKRVVFDDVEGRQTTCLWGYDNSDSLTVALKGVGAEASPDQDFCHVRCAIHDVRFADELGANLMAYISRRASFFNEYRDSREGAKMIAVVSHPHGYFKHVSLKIWSSIDQENTLQKKNALDTCEGSRGAPAYILDKDKNWLSPSC